MIYLDDEEVDTMLAMMALDSDSYQVRLIAVTRDAEHLHFSDADTGEAFSMDTTQRILAKARAREFYCEHCDRLKPITGWDADGHNVNMCTVCYAAAKAAS